MGDCRIIEGDALLELPKLEDGSFESIIVDPVWPNAVKSLRGHEDPLGLFTKAAKHFPRLAKRVVVHLGCVSDPRFLSAIPKSMPFLRACCLEYVPPSYLGRVLNTHDVAYVFGEPPPSRPGARVLPGKITQTQKNIGFIRRVGRNRTSASAKAAAEKNVHPCPRHIEHVRWLVKWFAGESCLDPFSGAFTTGVACVEQGVRFTGIEIEPTFVALGTRRMADARPLFAKD